MHLSPGACSLISSFLSCCNRETWFCIIITGESFAAAEIAEREMKSEEKEKREEGKGMGRRERERNVYYICMLCMTGPSD